MWFFNRPLPIPMEVEGAIPPAATADASSSFDGYSSNLILPALVFTLYEAFDGVLTTWAANHGFEEVNPLAAPYARSWLFPVSKVLAAVAGAIALWPAARKHPRLVKYGFTAVTVFVACVVISNVYEISASVI